MKFDLRARILNEKKSDALGDRKCTKIIK